MRKAPFFLSLLLLASCASSGGDAPETSQSLVQKTYWSQEVDKALRATIGEAISILPVYECSSYQVSNACDDATGIPYSTVYCYQESVTGKEASLYATALVAQGFARQSSSLLLKVSSDTEYLVLGLAQGDGKDGLALAFTAYLSSYRYAEWPSDEVNEYLGSDIPHADGDYYYVTASDTGSLQIQVEGVSETCASDYSSLLIEYDYLVTPYDRGTYTLYYAVSEEKDHAIAFAYDEDSKTLLIQISLLS